MGFGSDYRRLELVCECGRGLSILHTYVDAEGRTLWLDPRSRRDVTSFPGTMPKSYYSSDWRITYGITDCGNCRRRRIMIRHDALIGAIEDRLAHDVREVVVGVDV